MFKPSTMKSIVINELEKHPGYWWVPVIAEGEKGILEDVIHARVFWDEKIKDQSISDMIREVDTNANS
ncbi:MAG: hypothetical protein IPG99_15180 [Ignavibacteria bacterium]|nr:hypothetical protein [Ignavibacteria bacterium]